jgi:PAS domain S-box-containing protein
MKANEISVSGIRMQWQPDRGTCSFENLPVAMMWVDTTLAGLMSGVQAMVGTERFLLALQSEGRKSVEEDWKVISRYPDFREGFKAIANIAAVAGWGEWTVTTVDEEGATCRFRVTDSWEGRYQKALGVCWGSGMLAGKMAGYCSKLFGTNCWAEQVAFIARSEAWDEFIVQPSSRSIEDEINKLLATDEATRADMAVALRKLEQENADRQAAETALRDSQEKYRILYETSRDAIMTVDLPNWSFASGNRATVAMFRARDEAEFTSKTPWVLSPEHQPDGCPSEKKAKEMIEKAVRDGSNFFEWTHRRLDGELFPATVLLTRMEWKGRTMVQATVRDITEYKRAELALRESEDRFRTIFDSVNDAIVVHDIVTGNILDVNSAGCAMNGYTRDELLQLKLGEWGTGKPPYTQQDARSWVKKAVEEGPQIFEWQNRHKNGHLFWTEVNMRRAVINGQDRLLVVARDITERKRSEEELKASESILRSVFRATPVGITLTIGRVIMSANNSMCQLTGFSEQEIVGHDARMFYDTQQEYEDAGREMYPKVSQKGSASVETRFRRKDGTIIHVVLTAAMRRAEDSSSGFVVTVQDITERKRSEEAIQKLTKLQSVILDNSTVGIVFVRNRVIEWVNQRMPELFGIPMEQFQGASTCILYPSDEAYQKFGAKAYPLLARGKQAAFEVEMRKGDGSSFWCRLEGRALDALKHHDGSIWILEDITERKRAEEELTRHRDRLEELVKGRTAELEKEITERKAALAEKEVLLREVHHRVKNNLNTIANLLYFQTKTLEDKKALAAFRESQNRILSMARVHEHLYRSANLAWVNMAAYFEDLTLDLRQTCGRSDVAIPIDAAKEQLDIDQAIPCGLIVNELVTNSLKYAFLEGTTNPRNEVVVHLTTQADQHILEVRDNGVGLPAGMDVENSSSLGLRLVSMLTRQLKGRLTVDTAPGKGARFTLVFPIEIAGDPNGKK